VENSGLRKLVKLKEREHSKIKRLASVGEREREEERVREREEGRARERERERESICT
jgi:hypothetical protein